MNIENRGEATIPEAEAPQNSRCTESALIRLRPGGLAALDAASACFGLSRSAFIRDIVVPMAAELAERSFDLQALSLNNSISVAAVLSRALKNELAREASPTDEESIGREFEMLFGSE